MRRTRARWLRARRNLRQKLGCRTSLIARVCQASGAQADANMSVWYTTCTLDVLLVVLALAAYVDRIYSEMGKFLAREYQDNIDAWTRGRGAEAAAGARVDCAVGFGAAAAVRWRRLR